jgi:ectoine hydroxylase-related dioxygenase (phytanoyl-CoA dioxygenase family)
MNAVLLPRQDEFDTASIMGSLYGDGITALKSAFSRPWIARLREDIDMLFAEASKRPDGVLNRGPNRFYVEVHPEHIRGFVDLATHPWVTAVCAAVLGPDYKIVEAGFDIPFPGSENQPWHRDFRSPPESRIGRRLTSLAFNITTVDVTPEMGPFEIAPGTQWDDLSACENEMFPPKTFYHRYESRAQRKMPQIGDISARSALTIHRGTANRSSIARPVFVLGVDSPEGRNSMHHDLQVTKAYHDALPDLVKGHLTCRIVDHLENIEQAHTIEGLLMADS